MFRHAPTLAAFVLAIALAQPAGSAGAALPHIALREQADAFAAAPDAMKPILLARAAGFAIPQAPAVPVLGLPESLLALEHAADLADGRAPSLARDAKLATDAARVAPDLAAPLARIATAEAAAIPLVTDALSDVSPAERAAYLADTAFAPAPALVAADGTSVRGAAGVDPASLAGRVNVGELALAESMVLDAIEVSLPALKGAVVDSGPSPIVDAPYIAVDNTPSTVWTVDYYLMVDLQGDDTYLNHAGANTPGMIASVLVDVQGNDKYLATGDVDSLSVQGVGAGGLGVLVDGAGDDTYSADATRVVPDLTPAKSARVLAQGVASLGAGALVDLGGRDTISSNAFTRGGTATVIAQGVGVTGVGLLVDRGTPNAPGLPPAPIPIGSPAGSSFRATAESDLLLVVSTPTYHQWSIGASGELAQGVGSAGAGGFVGSANDDAYLASSVSGQTELAAQGAGELGAGLLVDAGGVNSFAANGIGDVPLRLVIGVVCPPNFICGESVQVNTNVGSSNVLAQGAANTGAGALVASGLGSDAFHAKSLVRTLSEAGVYFAGGGGLPGGFSAIATASSGASTLHAQGDAVTGAAFLAGSPGNDVYDLRSTSVSLAYANATGGASNSVSATASGGTSTLTGQGNVQTGVAALLDPQGNDAYSANSKSITLARQNGAVGSETPSTASFLGQAHAKTGLALFADLGGSDTYSSSPTGSGATNNACWTNSPPSLPGSANTDIAMGIDANGGVPASCEPVPPN